MTILLDEFNQINWKQLKTAEGFADDVAIFFPKMLLAKTEVEGEAAFWHLDNHVVLQGHLYEAAEYLIPFLISGTLVGTPVGKWLCLDLLVEIAGGYSTTSSEPVLGSVELAIRCKVAVRRGLPVYYYYMESVDIRVRDCASLILAWVETEYQRLEWYAQKVELTEIAKRFVDEKIAELRAKASQECK
jgi:hypothetical protein